MKEKKPLSFLCLFRTSSHWYSDVSECSSEKDEKKKSCFPLETVEEVTHVSFSFFLWLPEVHAGDFSVMLKWYRVLSGLVSITRKSSSPEGKGEGQERKIIRLCQFTWNCVCVCVWLCVELCSWNGEVRRRGILITNKSECLADPAWGNAPHRKPARRSKEPRNGSWSGD